MDHMRISSDILKWTISQFIRSKIKKKLGVDILVDFPEDIVFNRGSDAYTFDVKIHATMLPTEFQKMCESFL